MKKLYAFALAATCIISASASTESTVKAVSSPLSVGNNKVRLRTAVKTNTPEFKINADISEYTWNSIGTGKYVASVVPDTYGGTKDPVDVEVYEANEKAGVYKLVGVWPDKACSHELVVDASDPEFVIVPKQNTGIQDNVDGVTYIASWTWVFTEDQGNPKSSVIAQHPDIIPTLSDGIITFPAQSLALNWPEAPEDSQYGTDPGDWYDGSSTGSVVLPGAEYVDPWTLLGTATVSGDLLFGTFGKTAEDYEVELYQSTSDETQYKIPDLLKGLYSAIGWTNKSPDYTIDASDPTNVTIPLTTTGINGGTTDGLYYFCSYNQNYGSIDDCPEANRITLTENDGVITISMPYSSTYLYASTSRKLYNGNRSDVTITLTDDTAGIENIASDDNAPVEYFNLQGIRVNADNTTSGIYIRRQGSNTTKVLVK